MNIHYDADSHGLLIRFTDGTYEESEEVTPGVIIDFDAGGKPIGIELEDVRGFLDENALRRLSRPHIKSGADLRRFRERLGMTQERLGALLDIPRNTIARWERDELAIEKSRLLELALGALIGRDASPTRNPPRLRSKRVKQQGLPRARKK